MRIVQTVLRNMGQHENTKVRFGTGLIGIFGRNGVGKSNLLKLGGYANLTNDFSRNNKPKLQNIRYAAGKKDPAYSETEWEHDGHSFVIVRGLQNPKRDSLRSDLLENPVHKDEEIDEWVGKLLGLPNYKYLADAYVFVDQGQLTSFIADDPATRAKGFANLCGTTIAEACWKELGDQITKDTPLTVDVIDNSDDLRRQIGQAEETLSEARIRLRKRKKRLLDEETAKQLQEKVDAAAQRLVLIRQLKKAKAELQESHAAYVEAKEQRALYRRAVEGKQAEAGDAAKRLPLVREQLRTLAEKAKQFVAHREVNRELTSLVRPKEPKSSEPEASFRQSLSEDLGGLRAELKRAQEIEKNIGKRKLAECPTCGSSVAGMHDHLQHQKSIIEGHPKLIEAKEKSLQQVDELLRQWAAYRSDARSYQEQSERLVRQLETMPAGERLSPEKKEQLVAKETQYVGLLAAVTDAEKRLTDFQDEFTAAKVNWQADSIGVKRIRAGLAECTVKPEEVADAKLRLAKHQAAETEIATLRERCSNAKRVIADKQTELDTLQKRIAQTARMREWTALLQQMREVLHRDKLPKIVHEAYQEQLLPEANALLEKFRQPFAIETAENLVFRVRKPDGTLENADGLSGGEKVIFALAIRWAVHGLSAAGLSMLVLDEPTAWLDEANMLYLRESLPHLGAEARSRGLQLILVTHESSLKSVFDQVIELK